MVIWQKTNSKTFYQTSESKNGNELT